MTLQFHDWTKEIDRYAIKVIPKIIWERERYYSYYTPAFEVFNYSYDTDQHFYPKKNDTDQHLKFTEEIEKQIHQP